MKISSRIALAGALCLGCLTAFGQKSGSGSSSSGSSGDSGNGPGFSIETEMFTYKAVQQNGEAIACDIARSLYGGAVQDAPPGSHVPCVVNNDGQAPQGIVLISGGSPLVSEFQIWRGDMAAMDSLRARARAVCVGGSGEKPEGGAGEQPGREGEHGTMNRGLGSTVLGLMKSAAPGISDANAALGMLSSSQSVTSVVGTVHDPALMNEVARQLRALNIRILIPELYSPGGLSGPDASRSPYLRNLNELITAYDGCLEVKGGNTQAINNVIESIKGFVTVSMTDSTPAPKPSAGGAGGSSGSSCCSAAGSSESGGGGSGGGSGAGSGPPPNKEPHFAAVLEADAVAQKLGISDDATSTANRTWQHLLWVKALESGGSVTKTSNLFGTKVRFGGGAVDTFAIFRLDGDLVCSGNVYTFQSPVRLKDLDMKYAEQPKKGPAESPTLRSTCSMLPTGP